MIYLDSAATSLQKPPEVARAVVRAMQRCASPGRGDHAAAMRAAETVFACREEAAALFHMTQPENVVFTMNATHALNIAVHSLVREGMRVAVSGFEHNAVMRPLYASGASILTSDTPLFDSAALIDWFERHLPECDAAVCTCVSNVFGFILPVREIAALCRRFGVPLIVDASQSAGILDLDFPRARRGVCWPAGAQGTSRTAGNRDPALPGHGDAAFVRADRAATAAAILCPKRCPNGWKPERTTSAALPVCVKASVIYDGGQRSAFMPKKSGLCAALPRD